MISYVKGDLVKAVLDGKVPYFMHSANIYCSMGGGIAYQIANEIPQMVLADNETTIGDVGKIGTYNSVVVAGCVAINAYCQLPSPTLDDPSTIFSYEAFEKVLRDIKEKYGNVTIYLPFIGCGIAGGKWSKVEKVMESSGLDFVVVAFSAGDLAKNKPSIDWGSIPVL